MRLVKQCRGEFDKINMLVSFNVKMAIISLTSYTEIMVSVMERIVVSPVILASCVSIGLRTSSLKKNG